MRSYQDNVLGKLYFSFPNDIHFLWGKDSYNRIQKKINNKCENFIPNIILNGYSHISFQKKSIQNFNKNEINFLFMDTNSDINDSFIEQLVDKKYLNKLYENFFTLLLKFEKLHLTLKRKKNNKLNILDNNNNTFKDALGTKRLHIVHDNVGLPPSVVSQNMDYIFSLTTEDLPSALLECTQYKSRSIIIDYTNLTNLEKEIYKKGKNKIIFNDHNQLFSQLNNYLNNNHFDNDFGNWEGILSNIKSFDDLEGHKRISDYVYDLLLNLDNNKTTKESINIVNKKFINRFGNNYLISSNL